MIDNIICFVYVNRFSGNIEKLKKFIVSKRIYGIEELKSDFLNNKPEIVFNLDRERANREGISSGQIGGDLRTAIFGKEISKFRDVDED